ncbi:hypothetical protein M440DRAFT_173641 [Trichoderma longibrachiatum ATCC 18648]|uniref:Uncharacterized protein n=1 Tax=Trichoderma longibrachiatum ATCC 18648 TaxID=983965 RepID=A0A2T4CEA7_TRILO|nr:hypothetical protein M440DRAFT_173641 [Trichoderma longibrachiatum ATCC 18648]
MQWQQCSQWSRTCSGAYILSPLRPEAIVGRAISFRVGFDSRSVRAFVFVSGNGISISSSSVLGACLRLGRKAKPTITRSFSRHACSKTNSFDAAKGQQDPLFGCTRSHSCCFQLWLAQLEKRAQSWGRNTKTAVRDRSLRPPRTFATLPSRGSGLTEAPQ